MKSKRMDFFNFQLSHLFPQLAHHLFGRSGARSRISGAPPAGYKWLKNRYARSSHVFQSAHECARSGLQAQNASIPVAPPQPGCRAFGVAAAPCSQGRTAGGVFLFIFFGCRVPKGAVCIAMRSQWLRFAHASLSCWRACISLRAIARLLRLISGLQLGGSDMLVLRLNLSSPASLHAPVAVQPYSSANGLVEFIMSRAGLGQQ